MINQTKTNFHVPKVFIETYGCQMNEADSEIIKSVLAKEDFTFVKDPLVADIVMLNTCAIRENAHRKVYGRVHEIRHQRGESLKAIRSQKDNVTGSQSHKKVVIGILGCMATNLRQELLENESLDIDFIAGPDSYKRLPSLIHESLKNVQRSTFDVPRKFFDVTLSEFETYSDVIPLREKGVNAWVSVMRGCDNFCTFCVVPYTRGRERSRSIENVLEEVKVLASEGFKQVTLLGQNVNSYKHDGKDFADLLEAVSQVEGIERIRFTSPHPKDFPEKLIRVVATNPKVCKHIHLPLQAGNNRVLDLMNRTYTKEEFLALVDKIRAICPGIFLSTDVIVGFPTETAEEFEDTMSIVRQVEFDAAFIFKYSERKNTVASKKYPDDISEDEKKSRIIRLQDLQRDIIFKKNSEQIGKVHSVLIENGTNKLKNDFVGRTDGGHLVLLPKGDYSAGQFATIRICAATPHALRGEPLTEPALSRDS